MIYVSVIHILSFTPVVLPEEVKIKAIFLLGMFVSVKEEAEWLVHYSS